VTLPRHQGGTKSRRTGRLLLSKGGTDPRTRAPIAAPTEAETETEAGGRKESVRCSQWSALQAREIYWYSCILVRLLARRQLQVPGNGEETSRSSNLEAVIIFNINSFSYCPLHVM
jgi:hypothetical protein